MDLKTIYRAATGEQAERHQADFEAKWKRKYRIIGALWRHNWQGETRGATKGQFGTSNA